MKPRGRPVVVTVPTPQPDPPPDPLREFLNALEPRARAALRMTEQAVSDIHIACTGDWTPELLALHCSYHVIGLDNADQVIRARLHKAAHPDEASDG